jgi:hypothetical protein
MPFGVPRAGVTLAVSGATRCRYLNTLQFDYDALTAEFDQVPAHIREQTAAAAPA